ncbi:MAG: ferrous iron transport protein A [Tissierellia bacterium]|nr:ferrous iron transport protein A [Tissierellia bacterium]
MTLDKVEIGKAVMVTAIVGDRPIKRRIMDMGIIKGTELTVRRVAPLGDPIDITVRGYQLSIRKEDAKNIKVEEI